MAEKDYKKIYEDGVKKLKEKIRNYYDEGGEGQSPKAKEEKINEIYGMMLALDISSLEERLQIAFTATSAFLNQLPSLIQVLIHDMFPNCHPED